MEKLKASVEEFTTPDPITTTELATIEEMAKLMKQNGIRHLPIMKNQEVVGIVSERDLNLVASLDIPGKQFCAKDIMAKDPVAVSSESPLKDVAFEMSQKKIGSVMVYDGREFLGIFTVTDALNALTEILREQS